MSRLPHPVRRSLTRPLLAAVTLAAVSPAAMAIAPAQACGCPDEGIAVKAPRTAESGESFRISGVWIQAGTPAAGRTVRVQTKRDGRWQRLRGATVTTRANGEFGMRLVLQQQGSRILRVAGVNPERPHVFDRFVVRVG